MKKIARHRTVSLASASTLAAIATASSASAAIVSHTTGFTHATDASSIYDWDIDGVGGRELRITNSSGTIKDIFGFANGFRAGATGNAGNSKLLNLAFGANVSTAATGFANNNILSVMQLGAFDKAQGFVSGATGYIGFQFNPTGSLVLFGWAEVILTLSPGGPGSFEVVQWAYEDTGAPISAGVTAIPEPASAAVGLGALALGAAALRRRRALAAA